MIMSTKPLILIDLDDTLIIPNCIPRVHFGTIDALETLKECGYRLVLFSHNTDAEWLCKIADIYDYFEYFAHGCHDQNKKWNLEQVCKNIQMFLYLI
jgi:phosphoserine phosphatase